MMTESSITHRSVEMQNGCDFRTTDYHLCYFSAFIQKWKFISEYHYYLLTLIFPSWNPLHSITDMLEMRWNWRKTGENVISLCWLNFKFLLRSRKVEQSSTIQQTSKTRSSLLWKRNIWWLSLSTVCYMLTTVLNRNP